jgi:uncharacterized repeat protein (TIGR01451 family)
MSRLWQCIAALVLCVLALLPRPVSADPLCANFATGGNVSLITEGAARYCVHSFTAGGTFITQRALDLQYLIVGGGGGGGSADLYEGVNYHSGGGGGAGGVLQGALANVAAASFNVVVGAGGAGGSTNRGANGSDSSFNGSVASGGGGGGGSTFDPIPVPPSSGGSGGGGGGRQSWDDQPATNGAAGVAGQGNSGGNGRNGSINGVQGANAPEQTGGGGGGAGSAGGDGLTNLGGTGGGGITSGITGASVGYAGGGGGGHRGSVGSGGSASHGGGSGGGGANAAIPGNGAANTGGGGGGAGRGQDQGGNGGSGVVVVRYLVPDPPQANAGPDQTVVSGANVTLDGSASIPAGQISYSWTQIAGAPVTLANPQTATPSFTAPNVSLSNEVLRFELTVTEAGQSSADSVDIVVSAPQSTPIVGTGGTIVEFNDPDGSVTWRLHSFLGNGTLSLPATKDVQYLVVGGGGGAGTGGGGAGGMIEQLTPQSWGAGEYTITVGQGGAPTTGFNNAGSDGTSSSIVGPAMSNTVQVIASGGGGGGRAIDPGNGRNGGSGGGGGRDSNAANAYIGGSGVAGQGNAGAANIPGSVNQGGGGGGAGGAANGMNGGAGRESAITGTPVLYAGGGASARGTAAPFTNGTPGAPGARGSGGTHGEAASSFFNAGEAGIVYVRYAINTRPTANAGPDATALAFQQVTLDGSGSSDPDDNLTTYVWVQTAGTAVILSDPSSPSPSFTPGQPANGAASEALAFALTVTDAFGLSHTEAVTITLEGVAVLAATKSVTVFSEDGSGCADFEALQPEEPALPAAIPGACIQYRISVQNTGPVTAANILLVDPLPNNLSFQAARLGTAWGNLLTLNCPGIECELRIEDGSIGPGQTALLFIRATIN